MQRCSAHVSAAAIAVFLLIVCCELRAQSVLHEGNLFLAGFIHPERAPGEPLARDSYRIIVGSRYLAQAVVAGKVVYIQPNTSVEVVIDSCDVALVTSDKPITVASRIFMNGNGEQTMHIPTHAWGKQYHPFSWWTDRYGIDTLRYTTARRLIIAREDSTIVDVQTNTGRQQFTLNAFEYAYVPVTPDTTHYRDAASDPTGELFVSNKPIGVVSGHAKTAVLEHPDAMPSSGPYARAANRTRGTLMESMIPIEHAGTTFITVPFQYSPTRKRGQDNAGIGISDDRGDVIRFISTTASTVLSYLTDTGTVVIDTLDAGEVYTARTVESARLWNTTNPVLCAQYGKSYGHITSQATLPEDDPSTDAGLPMLVSIPSTLQWTSHALFSSPPDLISYVTIVTLKEHIPSITFDGKYIKNTMGITGIPGTEYATARLMINPGNHAVSTSNPNVTFMTLTYGNLDGLQLCNAYASTAGVSLQSPCPDSIDSKLVHLSSDSAHMVFTSIPLKGCKDVSIAMVYSEQARNCNVRVADSNVYIQKITNSDSAYAIIKCISRHGTTATKRIDIPGTTSSGNKRYLASQITVSPNPCSDELRLSWNTTEDDILRVRLVNELGNICLDAFLTSGNKSLDISMLPIGTYLLFVKAEVIPVMIVR